ncbi:MAG: hypothetical protein H0X39_17375 [Actinobacteria bacterium]|nr:hypothetical protein [Actinomycetota bacterium]
MTPETDDAINRWAGYSAIIRLVGWLVLIPAGFALGWESSIAVLFILSCVSPAVSEFSAWLSARNPGADEQAQLRKDVEAIRRAVQR